MRAKHLRSRKPARVANSRWIAYATAGAATALGAAEAEAEIHYSGVINVLILRSERTFPLSNGAVLWFQRTATNTSYAQAFFEVRNGEWQSYGQYVPANLSRNQPVSTQHFRSGVGVLATSPCCCKWPLQFCERGPGILGFKFDTGRGPQYGWARLRMHGWNRPPDSAFYVVEYAWADPGEDIKAGQTHSLSQEQGAVSPSGSLGLLALGKAGLDLWRAQRFSSATGR
jgi:hypothetical protein